MPVLSMTRNFTGNPNLVTMVVDDDVTDLTTTGYLELPATEASIEAIQNGEFQYEDTDYFLIAYDGGIGFFTRNAATNAFVTAVTPGGLTPTLSAGNIFVGNALNAATGVPVTGDISMSNAGVASINPGVIDDTMLDAALQPSHVVKFAAQVTTAGGAAAEAITVTGALATDLAFVQLVDPGTNTVAVVQAAVTADTLTVTFDADPGNDAIINYQIIRAV